MLNHMTTHARKLALAAVIASGAFALDAAVANDWSAKSAKPLAMYQESESKEMLEAIDSAQPRTIAAPSVAVRDYSTIPENEDHQLLDAINRDYPAVQSASGVANRPNFSDDRAQRLAN